MDASFLKKLDKVRHEYSIPRNHGALIAKKCPSPDQLRNLKKSKRPNAPEIDSSFSPDREPSSLVPFASQERSSPSLPLISSSPEAFDETRFSKSMSAVEFRKAFPPHLMKPHDAASPVKAQMYFSNLDGDELEAWMNSEVNHMAYCCRNDFLAYLEGTFDVYRSVFVEVSRQIHLHSRKRANVLCKVWQGVYSNYEGLLTRQREMSAALSSNQQAAGRWEAQISALNFREQRLKKDHEFHIKELVQSYEQRLSQMSTDFANERETTQRAVHVAQSKYELLLQEHQEMTAQNAKDTEASNLYIQYLLSQLEERDETITDLRDAMADIGQVVADPTAEQVEKTAELIGGDLEMTAENVPTSLWPSLSKVMGIQQRQPRTSRETSRGTTATSLSDYPHLDSAGGMGDGKFLPNVSLRGMSIETGSPASTRGSSPVKLLPLSSPEHKGAVSRVDSAGASLALLSQQDMHATQKKQVDFLLPTAPLVKLPSFRDSPSSPSPQPQPPSPTRVPLPSSPSPSRSPLPLAASPLVRVASSQGPETEAYGEKQQQSGSQLMGAMQMKMKLLVSYKKQQAFMSEQERLAAVLKERDSHIEALEKRIREFELEARKESAIQGNHQKQLELKDDELSRLRADKIRLTQELADARAMAEKATKEVQILAAKHGPGVAVAVQTDSDSPSFSAVGAAAGKRASVITKVKPVPGIALTDKAMCKITTQVFEQKLLADVVDDRENNERQPFKDFLNDFMLNKYGLKSMATKNVLNLKDHIVKYKGNLRRVIRFGQFLGWRQPQYPPSAPEVYLDSLREFKAGDRPLQESEPTYVDLEKCLSVIKQLCARFGCSYEEMEPKITAIASKNTINGVMNVDGEEALDFLLEQWLEAPPPEEESPFKLIFKYADTDGDGVLALDEFKALMMMVAPDMKMRMVTTMFLETLAASGTDSDEMTPEGFELVMKAKKFDANFVRNLLKTLPPKPDPVPSIAPELLESIPSE